jgi:tellurite resistance protein
MPIDTSGMRILDMFRKLNSIIGEFAESMRGVVEKHEMVAPNAEIRRLMESIKSRHAIDEKDKKENEEISKLLSQLSNDKKIFSLVEAESEEWLELLDAIEKRLEIDKDTLTGEDLKAYVGIKKATDELREYLRSERA